MDPELRTDARQWRRPRGWRLALTALVAGLAIAVPIAWASHDFTDVPDANPFHADISAIKNAGITSGKTCDPPGTPPTYCPTEGITREAMAAFVHRGFGRVAFHVLPQVVLPNAGSLVTPSGWSFTLTSGGVAGNGFIKIDAMVETFANAGCPCQIDFIAFVDGGSVTGWLSEADAPALTDTMMPYTAAVPVGPGVHTIEIRIVNHNGVVSLTGLGQVTAEYVPFGSTGGNTLAPPPDGASPTGTQNG